MAELGNPPSIVVQQTTFGRVSTQTLCPHCRSTVVTHVVTKTGGCTYLACFACCLLCCPCFWIPFVIGTCKDIIHMCPSCNSTLGIYKAL